jgi:hypothetical protein
MNFFDRLKQSLIEDDLGEIRTKQKMEFFPKVAAHAFWDERQKLQKERLATVGQHLAKIAAQKQASDKSRDENKPTVEEMKR